MVHKAAHRLITDCHGAQCPPYFALF